LEAKAFVDASGDCDLGFLRWSFDAITATAERSTSALLGPGSAGIAPEADVSAGGSHGGDQKSKGARRPPDQQGQKHHCSFASVRGCCGLSCQRGLRPHATSAVFRAPRSPGAPQAWDLSGDSQGVAGLGKHAYLASTGPEFRHAPRGRHINSVEQLTWQHVTEGRRAEDCVALGSWGVEWHDRETFESSFVYPPDGRQRTTFRSVA